MIDYTTPEGQVRLITGDTNEVDPDFTDAEIAGFLALNDGSVRRAAADALDATASNEALISKKIRTQDRESDGPAVAAELRKHAEALRRRADQEDEAADGEAFFTAFNFGPSGSQEGEEARL